MSEQKIKITAAVLTVLLFISLILVGITMKSNSGLKKEVDTEKLISESTLAEKLKLDKQILEFKKDLASLSGKNAEMNQFVADMEGKLAEREESVRKLGYENGSLRKFRKEAEDLRKMREQMESQISQLTASNSQLEDQIQELNQSIAGLQQQNQGLNLKISEMLSYSSTNFKVEVVRKKQEKLTHRAKRTHTLLVSFDMPKKEGKRNFRFDLQSPTGSNIPGELKVASIASTTDLMASIEGSAGTSKDKITLSYTPDAKLVDGTYTIFIFDGHQYLNNLQFRLSK